MESHPNMPPLNPRTNFRYDAKDSSLNGVEGMTPMADIKAVKAMTIEETLAAINNSSILN